VVPFSNPITQSVPVTVSPGTPAADFSYTPAPVQYKKSLQEEEEELLQAEIEREQALLAEEIKNEEEIVATEERAMSAREERERTEFLSFRSQEEYKQAVAQSESKKLLASQPPAEPSPAEPSPEPLRSPEPSPKSPLPSTKSISSTNIEEEIEEEIDEDIRALEDMEGTMGTGDITAVSELKIMPTNTSTNFDDSSSEDDGVVLGSSSLHDLKTPRTPPTPALAPPLAPAPTTPGATLDTTFFEEEPSSDEEDDVIIPDITEDIEELESTDEDELVVVTPSPSASLNTPRAPPIVVVVHYIEFEQAAHFIDKPDVNQVFVEYKLLGVDPADTETPQSLKVKGGVRLSYNFRKTFFIEKSSEEWVLLNEMVSSGGDRKITFTVVSDPGEATDKECINLCTATLELPTGSDLFDQTLDLISAQDGSKVGVICVTMETFKALLALGILPNNL